MAAAPAMHLAVSAERFADHECPGHVCMLARLNITKCSTPVLHWLAPKHFEVNGVAEFVYEDGDVFGQSIVDEAYVQAQLKSARDNHDIERMWSVFNYASEKYMSVATHDSPNPDTTGRGRVPQFTTRSICAKTYNASCGASTILTRDMQRSIIACATIVIVGVAMNPVSLVS